MMQMSMIRTVRGNVADSFLLTFSETTCEWLVWVDFMYAITVTSYRLFRRISNKTSTLRVTGLCEGNSRVTSEFPVRSANNAENVPIWWRHHAIIILCDEISRKVTVRCLVWECLYCHLRVLSFILSQCTLNTGYILVTWCLFRTCHTTEIHM